WTTNDYAKFADADYPVWLAKKRMIDDCNVGPLAVIGDSRATTNIVPVKVGPGVVNLGLSGASLLTMLEVSKRIVACPEPPKAVLITMDMRRFMDTDMFWEREVKYDLFPLDLEDIRVRARQSGDVLLFEKPAPFDIDARLKNWLFQAKFPSYYFGSLLAGYVFLRAEVNQGYLRDTLRDKGYHYFRDDTLGDNRVDYMAYRKHFAGSEFFESYFGAMLDLYEAHHIPVYFISAPGKTRANQMMDPSFKSEYAAYLEKWVRLYPGLRVLGDIFPSLPPEDFTDRTHLNVLGAVVWSQEVAALLAQARVDTGSFVGF
nr:hypothetical protein [Pseudomonadota bacterium]